MATLWLVVVGDTNDRLGELIKSFMDKVEETFGMVARLTGMSLEKVTVEGDDFNADGITMALEQVSPTTDDAVLFFSTCHGIHGEKRDPLPFFAFQTRDEMGRPHVYDAASIYQCLRLKQPRMLVMVTQACNQLADQARLSDQTPMYAKTLPSTASQERTCARLEQMFAKFRGELLCTSSQPGEVSSAWPLGEGGPFGTQFFVAFHEIIQADFKGSSEYPPDRITGRTLWELVMTGGGATIDAPHLKAMLRLKGHNEEDAEQGAKKIIEDMLGFGNPNGCQVPVWLLKEYQSLTWGSHSPPGIRSYPGEGWRTGNWIRSKLERIHGTTASLNPEMTQLAAALANNGGMVGRLMAEAFAASGSGSTDRKKAPLFSASDSADTGRRETPAARFCTECGTPHTSGTRFCSNCGAKFEAT
jgi:hypothetical protein